MSSLKDTIASEIRTVLKHLTEDVVTSTVDFIIKEGVKKPMDLRHITVIMLKTVLDTIDSSDLFAHLQSKYNAASSSSSTATMSALSSSSNVPRPANTKSTRQTLQDLAQAALDPRVPTYDKDSPYMPSGVKAAVKAGRRPTIKERELFVERIVDHCRECVPNLQRPFFNLVAFKIVRMHEPSFIDTLPVSSHGSDSLAAQLKNKFDNDDRNSKKKTPKQLEAPPCKEAFGCISWNPPIPEDATLESLEQLKTEMKTMFRVASRDWEWRVIKTKVRESFPLQRKEINGSLVPVPKSKKRKRSEMEGEEAAADEPTPDLSIVQIHENWPFLFTCKGINHHFLSLTGVDFSDKLSTFLSEVGQDLVDFLSAGENAKIKRLKRHMRKAEKQGIGSALLGGLLQMLIVYLKEFIEELITFVEPTSTLETLQESTDIAFPAEKTPFLIIAGTTLYDFQKIYFAADNKVLTSVRRLSDAVVLLFTSYYVFNYQYNTKISAFLLFIQRKIAELNPATGSKCQGPQVLKRSNDRIRSLSNKFVDMQAKWKEDDKEN